MRFDSSLGLDLPLTLEAGFLVASLALFLVAAIPTLIRLIVFRFVRQRQWWWDDLFAFLGLLCLAVFVPGEHLHRRSLVRREPQ